MLENTSFCLIEPLDISHATHNELPLPRLDLEKHFFFFFVTDFANRGYLIRNKLYIQHLVSLL